MPRLIAASNTGEMFLVSDEDYLDVINFGAWYIGKNGYVTCYIKGSGRKNQQKIYLHHFISDRMGWPRGEVDHRDLDPLNCDRNNLRQVTSSQNKMNQIVHSSNKLGVKGVWMDKNKFTSQICINGEKICLGNFETLEEAKEAYRLASLKYHGDFGRTE